MKKTILILAIAALAASGTALAVAPSISLTTQWPDTSYSGPFTVRTVIRGADGVGYAALGFCFNPDNGPWYWSYNGWGNPNDNWIEEYTQSGDTFYFDIPSIPAGMETPVLVAYSVYAEDFSLNWREDPGDNQYYSFLNTVYNPEFSGVTVLRDTFYSGPFVVSAGISSPSTISSATLTYDLGGSNELPYDSIGGDGKYYFSIPRHPGNAQTPANYLWYLTAYDDASGNWSYHPTRKDTLNHFALRDPWPTNTSVLPNTGQTGPFPVWTTFKSEGPIANDSLWIYSYSAGSWLPYPRDSVGTGDPRIHYYTMPQQDQAVVNPITVYWYIKAYDGLTGNYVLEADTVFKFNIYDWQPPQITSLTKMPNTAGNGPFEVFADIRDTSGIHQARLYFRSKPSADTNWLYLPMYPTGAPNQYRGVIPVQEYGSLVQYYVQARDGATDGTHLIGNTAFGPSGGTATPWQFFAGDNNQRILLVDDALPSESFGSWYAGSLDTVVTAHGYWDNRLLSATPLLSNFNMVIWFTGSDSLTTLNQTDRDSLAAFLDRGGNLLLSSKNLGQNIGDTSVFFSQYLKARYLSANANQVILRGQPAYPVSNGNSDSLTLTAFTVRSCDRIEPLAGADSVFTYRVVGGSGVVRCSTGTFKTVFCAVPLEGLASATANRVSRTRFIARSLKWFGADVFYEVEGGPEAGPAAGATRLLPARPNPMRGFGVLSFNLEKPSQAGLRIYNIGGQLVRTLYQGQSGAGAHSVKWDGRDDRGQKVSGGVYFYKLEAGGHRLTDRLVVIR
ncbi:MAG TPA: hypothetical protein DDW31_06215 [candidate division Zixibacteria bacterium]|nr:hypothetical protein [candidate division Zixibacteria bacterium]